MATKTTKTKGVTATALGQHLDLSRQRIAQLADEGVITPQTDGTFVLDECRLAYIRWLRSEERRASKAVAASKKDEARTRKIELEIAEMEHRLIDIEEHDAVMEEVLGIVRSSFEALPAQMTRDPTRRREIEDKINAIFAKASARLGQRSEELRATGHITEAAAEV